MNTPKVGDTVYVIERNKIVAKKVIGASDTYISFEWNPHKWYVDREWGSTPEEAKSKMLAYKNNRLLALKKQMDKLEKDIDKIHKIKTDV